MKSQSCSSCFLSEDFPNTKINENGKCTHCNDQELDEVLYSATSSDISHLNEMIDNLRHQKRKKYDCIIGASGGLDSSYVIYIAKKELGLNPLVISYNHGFTYKHALDNIKRICLELDIDLRVISSARRNDYKYIKDIVRGLNIIDLYWGICSFCHYILPAVVYKTAVNEVIPIIFTSTNNYEEKLHIPANFRLKFMLKSLNFKNVWKIPFSLFYLLRAQYHLINLKLEFYLPPFSNLFKRHPKCPIISIDLTKYKPWNIRYMIKTLNENLGWELPQHPNIRMRFDCKIEDSFINYTYKKATGATIHSIISSNLVSRGVFTKSEMEEAVIYYDSAIKEKQNEVLNELGLKIRNIT
jgi:hypothetical protein